MLYGIARITQGCLESWKASLQKRIHFLHTECSHASFLTGLLIHSLLEQISMSTYHVPGTILRAKETSMNKTDKNLCLHATCFILQGDQQHISEMCNLQMVISAMEKH